ncbi:MAG: site-specific DNA-methyltransferase [Chloroflexi bacterium]|nr:site-specific DNA-methyltransferase [Chloroflexota bacterium]
MRSRQPKHYLAGLETTRGIDFPGEQGVTSALYSTEWGSLYRADCIDFLKMLSGESVDLVFADPPYGISKADWDTFDSQEEYVAWSDQWIREAARVLKPHGSLYICGFSEILADVKVVASRYFSECRWLIWYYRNKHNLGRDWGRSHESLLHLRKSENFLLNMDAVRIPYNNHTLRYPDHPQAESSFLSREPGQAGKNGHIWRPHPLGAKPRDVIEIPALCNGMAEKTPHPTQKPEKLVETIVLASSNKDNLVVDPFGGSGTTYVVCERLHRRWLGCELEPEYCKMVIGRLMATRPTLFPEG